LELKGNALLLNDSDAVANVSQSESSAQIFSAVAGKQDSRHCHQLHSEDTGQSVRSIGAACEIVTIQRILGNFFGLRFDEKRLDFLA
jgi:hypothetical protein